MPIAKPKELSLHYSAHAFLGTKDRFFILHGGDEDQFEVWDASLSTRLFSQIIPGMNRGWMKLIGETIFLIGWEEIRHHHVLRNIHVYPFNIRTNQPLQRMEFSQEYRDCFDAKTQFDLNETQAFAGLKNGIICIWNLKGNDKTQDCIFYEETGDEDNSGEKKVLKGHSKEITALRVAGNFLFSGAHDGTIKQWDLAQHQCVQTIETGLDRGVFFLKVEGPYIFGLADERHTICQWDIATGELLLRIDLEGMCYSFYVIYNLLFCFYGKKSKLQMIQIYDLSTKKCIKTQSCQTSGSSMLSNLMQVLNDRLYIMGYNELIAWDFSNP
jgi:WD40 repeat protein